MRMGAGLKPFACARACPRLFPPEKLPLPSHHCTHAGAGLRQVLGPLRRNTNATIGPYLPSATAPHTYIPQDLQAKGVALALCQREMEREALLSVLRGTTAAALGTHGGRSAAAVLIHRCLLRWHSLEGASDAPLLCSLAEVSR